MDQNKPSKHRVVMARRLAARWLKERAKPEYRMRVLSVGAARERKALPNLLRSFRDDKIKLGGEALDPIPDLGVREGFDEFVVWTSDRNALMKLAAWLEAKGYETSGIW